MPRPRAALPRAFVAALVGPLTLLLTVLAPTPAHAAKRVAEQTPLVVAIDSLSPSALRPRPRGTVVVSGTVTNVDDEPWRDVTVYPFASTTPMTTAAEVAEAAETDESAEVGSRILDEGDYVRTGDIAPSQTVRFTLTVPRADLPMSAPGVYWFGVHALGSGPEGQDGKADGRARTFLPLLPDTAAPVRAALLVPLRQRVLRTPDGSLENVRGWQAMLTTGGRLSRLVDLGLAAGSRRLSWLVDPAVLDAVAQLAAGNPPRNLGATLAEPGTGTGTASPSPSTSPSASAPAEEQAEEPDPLAQATAPIAQAWLDRMLPLLRQADVLALPYGDLDLAGAAEHAPQLYETARIRSTAAFDELGISATAVDAPPDGLIDAAGLDLPRAPTPMVLSDAALPEELVGEDTERSPVLDVDGHQVVATSSAAASGGPGPGDRLADVPLRQRLLAEAAVRSLGSRHAPLVALLSPRWHPADPTGFVGGLDQPWLQLPGFSGAIAGQLPADLTADELRYPDSAGDAELDGSRFSSAQDLMRIGRSMQRVLVRNDRVAAEVVDESLTDVGYAARKSTSDPAALSRGWISATLGRIQVRGPSAVTLSGAAGRFAATVVNGLDQPVSVAIRPVSDSGITIQAPRTVEVAARGQATVLLEAVDAQVGVHNVALQLVDSDGDRLGGTAYVPIRAAQVSKIIWLFLAVGGALLFGAITLRLVRRIRGRRAGAGTTTTVEAS